MKQSKKTESASTRDVAPLLRIVTNPPAPLSANGAHALEVLTDCLSRTVAGEYVGAVVVCADLAGELTTHLAGSYAGGQVAASGSEPDARSVLVKTLLSQLDELSFQISVDACDEDAEAWLDQIVRARETAMRLQIMLGGGQASAELGSGVSS